MRNPDCEKRKVELPAIAKIRSLDETSDGYKYLRIIEADDIKHSLMKEYYRRVRNLLTMYVFMASNKVDWKT